MLTKELRQTIDNARDVLVGKVPNPQSQIEQITIAMIYKFMDDMDKEAIELGGTRQFFAGELEQYAWSNLMLPSIGANDKMKMYRQALELLPLQTQIPKLFRDIFKGAYLPFNDPQTLLLFLKEINDIPSDNSENLGNGFEYLLSIMGSQGDAGMFRTPRNIIDFIVDVVKPTKEDSILDPACGTAGFLISAYKHILETARNNKPLTAIELKTLVENIQGYDISPEMVKLALVNLYLHNFKEPKIYEYDTLTNLDRWEETADIILANPPFMTPKGGIQPHNRFGIKANRSEVLFVDYIMEHLNSTGKAGVVVPEGIVFQSANAYKQLRKKLVDEKYLYAVVSLPSGVFNPYAGVKTSILFMDKQLAKQTDKILFVEVKQDGFDLGAQRRETPDKNDLPEALELLNKWQDSIKTQSEFQTESKLVTIVKKTKLAEGGEYNLTASRYKETQDFSNCKWEMVYLSDIVSYSQGVQVDLSQQIKEPKEGYSKFLRIENYTQLSDDFRFIPDDSARDKYITKDEIVVVRYGATAGFIGRGFDGVLANNLFVIKNNNTNILSNDYLYHLLRSERVYNFIKEKAFGGGMPALSFKVMDLIQIPLPPLEIQEEIVRELDGYQAVIDGAQKVIDNWKPTLPLNPNWQKVKLNDIATLLNGRAYSQEELLEKGKYPVLRVGNFFSNRDWYYSDLELPEDKYCDKGDLLYAWSASFGPKIWDGEKVIYHYHIWKVLLKGGINKKFLYYLLLKDSENIKESGHGIAMMHVTKGDMEQREFLIPTLEEQNQIVEKIEAEEKIVEECKKLIQLHQEKINAKIKSIWGE